MVDDVFFMPGTVLIKSAFPFNRISTSCLSNFVARIRGGGGGAGARPLLRVEGRLVSFAFFFSIGRSYASGKNKGKICDVSKRALHVGHVPLCSLFGFGIISFELDYILIKLRNSHSYLLGTGFA